MLVDVSFLVQVYYDKSIYRNKIVYANGISKILIFFYVQTAMQEEVLKLVLLALEDGSALSRKVLVMFVVQRLESHFPQASKTSIGHVVQLLYRASCFKVIYRF